MGRQLSDCRFRALAACSARCSLPEIAFTVPGGYSSQIQAKGGAYLGCCDRTNTIVTRHRPAATGAIVSRLMSAAVRTSAMRRGLKKYHDPDTAWGKSVLRHSLRGRHPQAG